LDQGEELIVAVWVRGPLVEGEEEGVCSNEASVLHKDDIGQLHFKPTHSGIGDVDTYPME
jgi:hypothetical protein